MVELRLTISDPKTGKSYNKILNENEVDVFKRKKLKETIKGDLFGFKDYEFEITGGSDSSGFPMRLDLDTAERKKILIVSGVGLKKAMRPGLKTKKSIRGNTVGDATSQVNLKVIKAGAKSLEELFGKVEPKEEVKEALKEEKTS